MPIYEYRCGACGHELEALQKMSDAPLSDCPKCGEPSLKKRVSAAAFRLKGGGWYETDFKSGDKKKNLAGDESKKSNSTDAAKANSGKSGDSSGAATASSSGGSKNGA